MFWCIGRCSGCKGFVGLTLLLEHAGAIDGRTYNAPTSTEVAAIIPSVADDDINSLYGRTFVRDIVLSRHDSNEDHR